MSLTGHVSIPSYNRANALQQYAYVNGRPVRDKLIAGAIRGAYADVLPRDRHAVTVLFLTLDPALVDVNVHPAKADVRFRDPGLVRGLIVGAIRAGAGGRGHPRGDNRRGRAMLGAFRPGAPAYGHPGPANGHRSLRSRLSGLDRRLRSRPLALSPARCAALAKAPRRHSTPGRSPAPTPAPDTAPAEEALLGPGLALLARRSTRTTSSPRPGIRWSSSTSMPRMSGSSTRR